MIQDAHQAGHAQGDIDTDGRLAITGAIRKVFVEQPQKFDPATISGPPAKR